MFSRILWALGAGILTGLFFGEAIRPLDIVASWIETRKASGEADEAYDYWVRGTALSKPSPRWSVLHNVLGWR